MKSFQNFQAESITWIIGLNVSEYREYFSLSSSGQVIYSALTPQWPSRSIQRVKDEDVPWRSALRVATRECCGFLSWRANLWRILTFTGWKFTRPAWLLADHVVGSFQGVSVSVRGGGVVRNGLHPERSDLAPLTPGYTRRRPSPPGRNSLHTRTVRLADPRRFRRISLETIRRALIVRVLCRKVVKLNQNNDRTEFSLICILHSRNIHQH